MANYPLVQDELPPDELWTFPQVSGPGVGRVGHAVGNIATRHGVQPLEDRVFALTIEPKKLAGIRWTAQFEISSCRCQIRVCPW